MTLFLVGVAVGMALGYALDHFVLPRFAVWLCRHGWR